MEKENKKGLSKKAKGLLCTALVLGFALIGAGGGIWYWKQQYDLPKFHNVVMELGEELPPLETFFTEYTKPEKAAMVTELSAVNVHQVGDQNLTFSQGKKVETVTLTVQDTTAPELTVRDVTATAADKLTAEDFVVSVSDLSPVTVRLAQPLGEPEHYGTKDVEVIAEDAFGNTTTRHATVSYQWMYPTATLELGDTLSRKDVLFDYVLDYNLVDQTDLDAINAAPVGEYTIVSRDGDVAVQCQVTVVDTRGPEVVLREIARYVDEPVQMEDFLVSVIDYSHVAETGMVTELDTSTPGDFPVTVRAVDDWGNETLAETVLHVKADNIPPVIYGLDDMRIAKRARPDYTAGVWAEDDRDGAVEFTYNADGVDNRKAGTYFVTYTATDKKGNVGTYRRKVVVDHDDQDRAALVASVAEKLDNDPEVIRDFVRNRIDYSYEWGDEDPVWFGLTKRVGNCYVHARVFQAILAQKGYASQLIWRTDKAHYWVLVNFGGYWRHMDATPGFPHHARYSIMTDEMRYETLNGGDWDRTQWPKAE